MSVLSHPDHRERSSSTGRDALAGWLLGAALLCTGLMAGLFYAFAISVLPGLSDVDARTFVVAMQSANAAILNPVFGLTFAGAAVLPALAVLRLRRTGHRAAAAWTTAALLLYVFVLVLTMGVSVPLNDQLAAAGDGATIADPAAVRDAFAGRWVPVNAVRALASTAALASLGRALFLHGGRR